MSKKPTRPRDPNQLGKLIVDLATSEKTESAAKEKNPAAVELGQRGGLKGGKARAKALTPEQRHEIARNAARKRWKKD